MLALWIWLALGPPIQRPSEGVPLRWTAPLECPDQAALRERVDALAPGLLDSRDAAGSQVEAEIRVEAEGYAATVVVRNDGGETRRELAAGDCELLADATALILAVTLDPVAVSIGLGRIESPGLEPRAIEPEPVEPEPIEPEPVAVDPELDMPRDRGLPDRPRRLRAGVRVLGGGGYGPTNTGYATVNGTLALIGPRWRAELGGLWAIPRVVRVDAGFGGSFDGWAILGRGCFAPTLRRLELPVCGGVELGSVRGRGLPDLPSSDRASFVWIAIAVGQGLWFSPIDRVAIGAELDLAIPLNRGGFRIESVEVQRIAAMSVRGLAGVELRW
ncbi:MAG TPA: hypothetical protein VK034_24390 [Enhygromyxa sp.]|nr:hypothetical protein [Enhygromyxa sp.]